MNDLKTIWKSQETENSPMALEDIRTQAGKLHSRVRWRNFAELAGAAVAVGVFGFYIWLFPDPLMRTGSVLVILGTLYVVWQLLTRARTEAVPGEGSAASWTDYYRSELVRQRDALKGVWKWYLAPMAPGLALFLAGMVHSRPQAALGAIAGAAAFCAVVFLAIGFLNTWAAGRLQKMIDSLGD
jgi:Flp pilus assembly protein TadB